MAAGLFAAAFVGAARHDPDSAVARAAVDAGDAVRARTGLFARTTAVQVAARRRLRQLERERRRLDTDRETMIRELGEAVYRGLDQRADYVRSQLAWIDEQAAAKAAEVRAVEDEAHERIERAHLEVQPTEAAPAVADAPQGERATRGRSGEPK